MGDGRDVLDHGDFQTRGLQGADGGLTTLARALDDRPQRSSGHAPWRPWRRSRRRSVRRRGWTSCCRGSPGRRRKPRTGRCPGVSVMVTMVLLKEERICDLRPSRRSCVSRRRADDLLTGLSVLAIFYHPSLLLLVGDGLLGTLAGAGVGLAALAAHGQAAADDGCRGSSRSPSGA